MFIIVLTKDKLDLWVFNNYITIIIVILIIFRIKQKNIYIFETITNNTIANDPEEAPGKYGLTFLKKI